MPYIKVKQKCEKSSGKSGTHVVYEKKKGGKRGKRVGCTSTPKKYMGALHVHAEEKEMKITKKRLRQIIKEEIELILTDEEFEDLFGEDPKDLLSKKDYEVYKEK